MEVSLSPSPARVYCCCSKPGSPFLREKSHIIWHRFPVFPSRRITQPLPGQTGFLTLKQKHNKVLCSQNQETLLLEARSIEGIYDALTERLLSKATTISDPYSKYIVGLAGPPGAGKSTLASEVAHRLNMLWPQKAPRMDELVEHADVAVVLPMDGFHLYRYQLDVMENPEEAHARRGGISVCAIIRPWGWRSSRRRYFCESSDEMSPHCQPTRQGEGPESSSNTMECFVEMMATTMAQQTTTLERLANSQGPANNYTPSAWEAFKKIKTSTFDGTGDPAASKEWVVELEKIFRVLGPTEE